MAKLKDVTINSCNILIGNYDDVDKIALCKRLYPDNLLCIKNTVETCGDDIRSLLNNIKLDITPCSKDLFVNTSYHKKFLKISKREMGFTDLIHLISQETTNYMLLIHENYIFLSDRSQVYTETLKNLYFIDLFNNKMFEQQQWYLGLYCDSFLLMSLNNLDFQKVSTLKVGTLWSKYSNWQYKRKLYNNFVYMKPNCIFYNYDFIYALKNFIVKKASSNEENAVLKTVQFIKSLHLNKEDFEQLLRVTTNSTQVIKGALKTKILKEFKNTAS
jgi:hypothetical protein